MKIQGSVLSVKIFEIQLAVVCLDKLFKAKMEYKIICIWYHIHLILIKCVYFCLMMIQKTAISDRVRIGKASSVDPGCIGKQHKFWSPCGFRISVVEKCQAEFHRKPC